MAVILARALTLKRRGEPLPQLRAKARSLVDLLEAKVVEQVSMFKLNLVLLQRVTASSKDPPYQRQVSFHKIFIRMIRPKTSWIYFLYLFLVIIAIYDASSESSEADDANIVSEQPQLPLRGV